FAPTRKKCAPSARAPHREANVVRRASAALGRHLVQAEAFVRRPRLSRSAGAPAPTPSAAWVLVEPEAFVQRPYRKLRVLGGDDAADFDFAGADALNVDAFAGQIAEGLGGDASMRAHAEADDRHLDDIGIVFDLAAAQLFDAVFDQCFYARQIGLGHRERDV